VYLRFCSNYFHVYIVALGCVIKWHFLCRQLIKIMRILVPGWFTAEVWPSFFVKEQSCLLAVKIFVYNYRTLSGVFKLILNWKLIMPSASICFAYRVGTYVWLLWHWCLQINFELETDNAICKHLLCLQGWYICLVAMALASRTYCDLWMIRNGTSIERSGTLSPFVYCYRF